MSRRSRIIALLLPNVGLNKVLSKVARFAPVAGLFLQIRVDKRTIQQLTAERDRLSLLVENSEQVLRKSEEFFLGLLVSSAADVITVISRDGALRYVSPSVKRVFGYNPEELIGIDSNDLVYPDDVRNIIKAIKEILRNPQVSATAEFRLRHKDGTWHYVEANYNNMLLHPSLHGFVVSTRNVTARKQVEELLVHRASHDSLTSLPNRTYFAELLEQALSEAAINHENIAVLFLDLDGFKSVNDTYGHRTGDHVLTAVGRRIQSCLRPDDVAARMGGDEFTVMLRDMPDASDATGIAYRIMQSLSEPFAIDGIEVSISASIGISTYMSGQDNPLDLLHEADSAMYRAKSNSKMQQNIAELISEYKIAEALEESAPNTYLQ